MTLREASPAGLPGAGHLARTSAVLTAFLREQTTHLRDIVGADDELWSSMMSDIERFIAGGKRLRPEFCYWGWRAAGGAGDGDIVVRASAALELLHAFALVHDDIIDDSDIRRGSPTVHRHGADLHSRMGLRGRAADFGTAVAILIGDLCLAWYHDMLDSCALGPEQRRAVRRLSSQTFAELIAGQYLDLAEQGSRHLSMDRSWKVIAYKTSKYTIERPMQLGGILAAGDPMIVDSYSRYAVPLGEAFQLRDDILGAFGDPAVTGKPDGDDLRTGKGTVLLATTRKLADDTARRTIDELLSRETMTDEDVARLREIMVETGAVTIVEERIGEQAQAAASAAEDMPVDAVVRDALRDLVTRTAFRDR
ncbi:polyprenyl synthetase family protein [Nocardia sp. NPDC004568]|uniref:polyprenyl synthetase family protein n=1 Tax=Nocardia sp. NPDC004568 TaxID=3154551 RepID=UPI0033AB9EAB